MDCFKNSPELQAKFTNLITPTMSKEEQRFVAIEIAGSEYYAISDLINTFKQKIGVAKDVISNFAEDVKKEYEEKISSVKATLINKHIQVTNNKSETTSKVEISSNATITELKAGSTTRSAGTKTAAVEDSELRKIINERNLEEGEYEIAMVFGKNRVIDLLRLPNKINKDSVVFYSSLLGGALAKRYGKPLVIPGNEDISLMIEQGTKSVFETTTGLSLNIESTTISGVIEAVSTLFATKDIRGVLAKSKKLDQISDIKTELAIIKDRVIKVEQFTITVKPNGEMFYANGSELTDATTKNKVLVRKELQDGTLRASLYNGSSYFVLSDDSIVGAGSTNLGKEAIADPVIKEKILATAVTYVINCE